MARIAKVVKVSVQELDRVKQNRNGVVGIPRKYLEEKAKALEDQDEWASFIDVLALLVFRVVLFPNVDGLVDLAAIDAFLAYHHSKARKVWSLMFWPMPMIHLTGDVRGAVQGLSTAHPLFMYGWSLTSFVMKVDSSAPYKVIAWVPRKGKQIGSNS